MKSETEAKAKDEVEDKIGDIKVYLSGIFFDFTSLSYI
jgi:hypothetical protein